MLLIKLSSLGDVVHTLPAAMDIAAQFPQARIDWVVEPAFAPLVRQCVAIDRVIEMDLRRWRRQPWSRATRLAWRGFRQALDLEAYDWILDLQGLTKSALVSGLARRAPQGVRVAMAHRTDGSSYEAPTRWVADRCVSVPPHIHAVDRAREVCARAMGYALAAEFQPGLVRCADPGSPAQGPSREVLCVHGTSRADKLWPEAHWIELAQRLQAQGWSPAFPHGNDEERLRAERLSAALPGSRVWPSWPLDRLAAEMATAAGVIGVDSGLSHIGVALGLPHVQIYNFDTAWRTGPQHRADQLSVVDPAGPSVDRVWQAWLQTQSGRSR